MSDWNQRYLDGDTPWDLGGPSPVVTRLTRTYLQPPARVLVPGCGRGHEAQMLVERGHFVTAVDLAPAAIVALCKRVPATARLQPVVGDVLDLPAWMDGAYDAVVEHTCMCALEPARWPDYVRMLARVLRPEGRLLGAFLLGSMGQGPPYGIQREQLETLLAPHFTIEHLAVAPEPFAPLGCAQAELVARRAAHAAA